MAPSTFRLKVLDPLGLNWKLFGGGRTPRPGEVVRPDERLSWGRTAGLGFQHVFAMFGATFVFPIVMGLNPNTALLMTGIATILFLLIVQNKVPSYLGTSASFVGAVVAIRAAGGTSATVTGSILVAGLVLAACGLLVHFAGSRLIHAVLPPAVTGAVVMLIGFNLAPVVATTYWPQDQWVALITMTAVLLMSVLLPGFWSRIAIFLGLIFGFLLSWAFDKIFGKITSYDAAVGHITTHFRVNFANLNHAAWVGLPPFHAPDFKASAIVLALPAVIALIAENTGHVKAVAAMTGYDLDPVMGRAILADGIGTTIATAVGGSPTTTYAENIGVMAATRVYSTAAYYIAAVVAILFGLCPKFGALIAATPGGVLGGITVILYGMIGLLGAKIWIDNRVDLGNPLNLLPLAAGIIAGIGDVTLKITSSFTLSGIALGTIVTILAYHMLRLVAPPHLREEPQAAGRVYERGAGLVVGDVETPQGEVSPFRDEFEKPAGPVIKLTGPLRAGPRLLPEEGDRPMKPSSFRYHGPTTAKEAIDVLADVGGDGKVLAGGQSLIPILNMRLAAPHDLVDINGVRELDTVTVGADGVRVGALARHARVEHEREAYAAVPLLRQALQLVAHPVIRNRGTTVGSLVHADPSGEMTAVLALLGGSVEVASRQGRRTVLAEDFFVAPLESAMQAGELAVSAFFPRQPERTGTTFVEVARRHGDYAVCGVAAAVGLDDDLRVTSARTAYISVGPTPVVIDVTEAVVGALADTADWAAAGQLAAGQVDPEPDIHATAEYRRHLVMVLTGRALREAASRALPENEPTS